MKKITKRIDNVTRIPETHQGLIPDAPIAAKIELMGACDFKCSFCATKDKLRHQSSMKFDLYKKIVKELHESDVKELGLFYLGESLLYPKLVEAIQYAKEIGFEYVFLTTNGYSGTKAKFKKIFKAGLDSLKFSYNYTDAENCKEITSVNAFNKIVKNIKNAYEVRKELDCNVGIYASTVEVKPGARENMKDALALIEPYIDEHYFLPLYNQAGFVEVENDVPGNPGRADALVDPVSCWSLFTSAHITHEGELTACCFDHDRTFIMGDLKTKSFIRCWHSTEFQLLRRAHIKNTVEGTPCATCLHRCNKGT